MDQHESRELQDVNPVGQVALMFVRENLLDVFLNTPSLPLVLLFRRDIGFRNLKPWMILLSLMWVNGAASLAMAGALLDHSKALGGILLYLAALATLILGVFWRARSWKRIKQQELWHTRSRGVSYLSTIMPVREDILQRFGEPAIAFALGLLLYPFLQIMSLYLMGAAVCLLLMEQAIYDYQLNQMLDQYDGIITAQIASQNAAHFAGKSDPTPPTIEQSAGVAVVVAHELQQLIARRKGVKPAPFDAAPQGAKIELSLTNYASTSGQTEEEPPVPMGQAAGTRRLPTKWILLSVGVAIIALLGYVTLSRRSPAVDTNKPPTDVNPRIAFNTKSELHDAQLGQFGDYLQVPIPKGWHWKTTGTTLGRLSKDGPDYTIIRFEPAPLNDKPSVPNDQQFLASFLKSLEASYTADRSIQYRTIQFAPGERLCGKDAVRLSYQERSSALGMQRLAKYALFVDQGQSPFLVTIIRPGGITSEANDPEVAAIIKGIVWNR